MNNKFPKLIPIFSFKWSNLLPKTNLPLNIFEPRYLDLVNDSYYKDKLNGNGSRKENLEIKFTEVGCLGKISVIYMKPGMVE